LPADPRMTASTYLGHLARLRGREQAAVRARSMGLLERFALSPSPDVPIGQLSKGNRQKVGLAQALGAGARLTVLDEPFAGLDRIAAAQLRAVLAEGRRDGHSVLISTHHSSEAEPGDLVHRLSGGRVVEMPLAERETVRPAAETATRLVLRNGREREPVTGEHRLELAALPGVRSVVPSSDGDHAIVVITDEPDLLLAVALGQSWSFVEGGPQAGERP